MINTSAGFDRRARRREFLERVRRRGFETRNLRNRAMSRKPFYASDFAGALRAGRSILKLKIPKRAASSRILGNHVWEESDYEADNAPESETVSTQKSGFGDFFFSLVTGAG